MRSSSRLASLFRDALLGDSWKTGSEPTGGRRDSWFALKFEKVGRDDGSDESALPEETDFPTPAPEDPVDVATGGQSRLEALSLISSLQTDSRSSTAFPSATSPSPSG